MFSCVKVVEMKNSTGAGTQSVTNVNDARTGTPFAVHTIINVGGFATLNTLMHNGNSPSAFHWDAGLSIIPISQGGASGFGDCSDFNLKVASNGTATGYSFLDTYPNIFFGGHISGYSYVTNVVAGGFDLVWDFRERTGDSKILICLGDTDVQVETPVTFIDGSYTTVARPAGVLFLNVASNGILPTVSVATGAGGNTVSWGWEARDSNRGTFGALVQGNNYRGQLTDRIELNINEFTGAIIGGTPIISAWGATSFTLSGIGASSPVGGRLLPITGATAVCTAGSFDARATDGNYSFNCGINAGLIIFATVGRAATGTISSDDIAEFALGVTDARNAASYWSGERTVGNVMPLYGARYLSDSILLQCARPDGSSTSFVNKMALNSVASNGAVSVAFSDTDGTQPQVIWLAIGTALIPSEANPILKMDTGGIDHDMLYDAYVKTRAVLPVGELGQLAHVRESYLTGSPTDATIRLTLHEDFDLRTPTAEVVMTGTGQLVTKKFEESQDADMQVVQFKLGDAEPTQDLWGLDKFTVQKSGDGEA